MTQTTMIAAIRDALFSELERDPRVIVLGQDVGNLGGVFRATEGLQTKFGPDRVVDMPLAEGVIVGASVGLAAGGLVPVAELQFLGFGHQAFHQIGQQVARMRFRSRGRFGLPLTIRAPFGGGVRTPELHADAFEAFYAHCPGLKVVAPATPEDAKGLLTSAIRDPDPVMVLEPLRGYRLISGEVPDGEVLTPIGKGRIARAGSDVTIIAYSAAVALASSAADILATEHGIDAEVLDLRTLVPLDEELLAESVQRTGRAVIVHEAPLTGGFGGEICATVQELCFYSLEAPIARVTAPDAPYPLAGVEEHYVPSESAVVHAVRRTVDAR